MNEPENRYDCYAVAVKSKLPGFLTDIIVGHVPIELSRYLFYAQEHGCAFTVHMKSSHYLRSPLTQGGLEIPVTVKSLWDNSEGLQILQKHIMDNYSINNNEKDDSKSILDDLQKFADLRITSGEDERDGAVDLGDEVDLVMVVSDEEDQ